jgi:hypothetical protein
MRAGGSACGGGVGQVPNRLGLGPLAGRTCSSPCSAESDVQGLAVDVDVVHTCEARAGLLRSRYSGGAAAVRCSLPDAPSLASFVASTARCLALRPYRACSTAHSVASVAPVGSHSSPNQRAEV